MTLLRKVGITTLILWTLGVTVLRALRTPNDFAEAHWLLDYRFGFVKRGLVGEILSVATRWTSIPITAKLITALATMAFLVYCTTVILLTLRIIHNSGWSKGAVLVTLVFLSSPFVVMSAHLNGYYDNIIIMLGVFSVALLLNGKLWLAACLQVLAVLVHENAMILVFPFFCLALLLTNRKRQELGIPSLPFVPLFLPILVFIIVTVNQSSLMAQDIAESFAARLSQFSFIQGRGYLAQVLTSRSLGDYFASQSPKFFMRLTSIDMYGLILPSALAILFFTMNAFRIPGLSVESLGLLGVCFAPQIMHLVAWDTTRIWTYTILCAFLVLWIYSENFMTKQNASATTLICLIALVANVVILTPLMDDQSDRFDLNTRLFLYAPVIVGGLLLIPNWGSILEIFSPIKHFRAKPKR